jgi:hypothetical protein
VSTAVDTAALRNTLVTAIHQAAEDYGHDELVAGRVSVFADAVLAVIENEAIERMAEQFVQRVGGLTPHEARMRAEERAERAEAAQANDIPDPHRVIKEKPMSSIRTSQLPTFEDIRRTAHRELGDVLDGLRSDWRPGTGPNGRQAEALAKARKHIALARAALDEAAES